MILGQFSSVLLKNLCCGYSLEAPRQGASNGYVQRSFYEEIRKNIPELSSNTSP